MANEIELKLKVINSIDIRDGLKRLFPDLSFETKKLINSYFDTPELALNQNKTALRIRKVSNQFIQTLKTKGQSINGLHQRREWEWPLPANKLNTDLLKICDAWPMDIKLDLLEPVFETNFTRQKAVLGWRESSFELALDQGEVISANQSTPINELEVELLSGNTEDLLALGELLKTNLSLEPDNVSKAERGYDLFSEAKKHS